MRSIKIQMLLVLCSLLAACTDGRSVQASTRGSDAELHQKLADCRAARRHPKHDGSCAMAIAERDKAAWRSQGRGIQIKPEPRP